MKTKNLGKLILILILLGLFVAYSGGYLKFQALPYGWTTLSLTKASFVTTAPGGLPSPVWILSVMQGGLAQNALGVIDNEEVGAMSGTKPKYDLKIEMSWDKLSWEYPIHVDYSSLPIRSYTLITWDDWRLVCYESDAKAKCGSYIYWGKFPMSATCFCIKETQETSYMGYLDNCNIHSISTIKLTAKDRTYSETIDTKGEISKNIGPYAYVVWDGNLMKQNCPTQSPYKPFYNVGWQLGDANYYNDYVHYYRDFREYMASCVAGANCDKATISTKINYVNSYGSNFIQQPKKFGEIIDSSSTDKAYVDLTVTSDVQVPLYTFYVSASWLEIYQPQPKPQIVEAKGVDFKSGEYGFLYVKFKNVGDTGNFEVWAECSSPIYVLDSTKTIGVSVGGESETYIKVGGNVASKSCQSCTIKVKGAGTNNIDSREVQVCVDPQKVCNPGTKECSQDLTYIRQCNSEGSGWVRYHDCASDEYCTYVEGEPKCVKKTPPTPSGECKSDADCDDGNPLTEDKCEYVLFKGNVCKHYSKISWEYILPIIFGLFTFLMVQWFFEGEKSAFRYSIAGVSALIAGLIVWWIVKNWLLVLILGGLGIAGYLILIILFGGATGIFWMFKKRGKE
jgi:hypothetical protein